MVPTTAELQAVGVTITVESRRGPHYDPERDETVYVEQPMLVIKGGEVWAEGDEIVIRRRDS